MKQLMYGFLIGIGIVIGGMSNSLTAQQPALTGPFAVGKCFFITDGEKPPLGIRTIIAINGQWVRIEAYDPDAKANVPGAWLTSNTILSVNEQPCSK